MQPTRTERGGDWTTEKVVCCTSSYTPLCEKGPVDSNHEARSLARHDKSREKEREKERERAGGRQDLAERLRLPASVRIIPGGDRAQS